MWYIDAMKEIVTSWTDFERLMRTKAFVYVDKTEYMYRMARVDGGFFFISRPRRFGKSLMCSTLDALFSGKKELFEGLSISDTDYDFKAHPVLRFDFSKPDTQTFEDFLDGFRVQLHADAARYGKTVKDAMPSRMMDELLSSLVSPVIIIDEFDSAIIDAVSRNEKDLAEKMRVSFNSFYKVIKSHTGNIRFLFITGCTKLSGLSIFSAMNNIRDITLSAEYATAFGYTEEELIENFSEHIDEKVRRSGEEYGSRDGFISALRDYYDGYRFSPKSETKVYNPVSIGNYFADPDVDFSDYWMQTGGASTLAVTLARDNDLLSIVDEMPSLPVTALATFDISFLSSGGTPRNSVLALLYYAGYLTIGTADRYGIALDFPNAEVRTTFLEFLTERYTRDCDSPGTMVAEVMRAGRDGDHRRLVDSLNTYYRMFNYEDLRGDKERHIRNLFKAFFGMLDYAVGTEIPAGKGRLDAVLIAECNNYVFEFKVDGKTSEDAFSQIIERNYEWVFSGKGKPLHLIGLDFRTDRQQIVSYTHQLYGNGKRETYDLC